MPKVLMVGVKAGSRFMTVKQNDPRYPAIKAEILKPRSSLKKKSEEAVGEDLFEEQLKARGITGYERQAFFMKPRRYRADFYWPDMKLDVEIDGGIWKTWSSKRGNGFGFGGFNGCPGRHNSPMGYEADRERDAEAWLMGVKTVRFTIRQVKSGAAIRAMELVFFGRTK